MEVASFKFEELQMNLLGDGSLIGMLEGEAHIDRDGAIVAIEFVQYKRGGFITHRADVPLHTKNDLTHSEWFVREAANQLEADHDIQIKETLDDWRLARREREYEAA